MRVRASHGAASIPVAAPLSGRGVVFAGLSTAMAGRDANSILAATPPIAETARAVRAGWSG